MGLVCRRFLMFINENHAVSNSEWGNIVDCQNMGYFAEVEKLFHIRVRIKSG